MKRLSSPTNDSTTDNDVHKQKNSKVSLETSFSCRECNATGFLSRNALFRHLKEKCRAESSKTSVSIPPSPSTLAAPSNIQERLKEYTSIQTSYIVVTGGRLRGRTLKSCERYCIGRQAWEFVPYMLENRGSHGAAIIDHTLYAVGGGGLDTNLSTCEKLLCDRDTKEIVGSSTNTWEYIAPMKTERHALSVLTHKNKIYAIGGWYNGTLCSGEMEIYDPDTNTWSMGPSMAVSRRLLATTVWMNHILSIGGCCADGDWNSAAVESFDCDTSHWTRKADAPWAGQASACTIDDCVYVFVHCREVYKYDPFNDTWDDVAKFPVPDWSCFQTVQFGRFVFVLGGASQGKWLNAFWVFDTLDHTWWELSPMLRQRRRPAAALLTFLI